MRPPESWSRARVTLAIVFVTAAIWTIATLLQVNDLAISAGAFIPDRIGGGFVPAELGLSPDFPMVPSWLTPLTAAFLHANFIHVAFNLLILAFCGRSTENVLGPVNFTLLYVVGAYAAAAGHFVMGPTSVGPMIGASGAASAVLGAYAILFGRNKVKVSNPRLALWLNALWLMAAWVGLQALVGYLTTRLDLQVAVGAHIGGFLAGVALAYPLLLLRYRGA